VFLKTKACGIPVQFIFDFNCLFCVFVVVQFKIGIDGFVKTFAAVADGGAEPSFSALVGF